MRIRTERGQASVEFALVIPLVFVALLVVAQIGLVVTAHVGVAHTAREVARAVAVDPAFDANQWAREHAPVNPSHLTIDVAVIPSTGAGGRHVIQVTARYRTPAVHSLFASVASRFEVTAQVRMLSES